MKKNKAPGPDMLTAELIIWMNQTNREKLLQLINNIHEKDELEETLNLANVASIFKKGDSSKLANYRPISLLQASYKIMAALIKERLDAGLDQVIYKTQYGFRHDKSTSQAIFLARRILDMAEQTNQNLTMILLDWEKAFDKVDPERLIEALKRLKVPERMLKLIKLIYQTPTFSVKTGNNKSEFLKQSTGIRQGCPLSPYLFILLMTVMILDIKAKLTTPAQREPIKGLEFSEILYADDTLIFGRSTLVLKKLLKAIQVESEYYNMRLNYDKCINLTLNRNLSNITYQNGELVPRKTKAIYLGTLLTDTNDHHAEINNRIAECTTTANKLKLFWNKANTTIKWKLQVFDAIVRSKLLYGLETVQLTQNEKLRIDAHQMKGIRRILKIPPTHIDRTWTNNLVMKKANEEINKNTEENS